MFFLYLDPEPDLEPDPDGKKTSIARCELLIAEPIRQAINIGFLLRLLVDRFGILLINHTYQLQMNTLAI